MMASISFENLKKKEKKIVVVVVVAVVWWFLHVLFSLFLSGTLTHTQLRCLLGLDKTIDKTCAGHMCENIGVCMPPFFKTPLLLALLLPSRLLHLRRVECKV